MAIIIITDVRWRKSLSAIRALRKNGNEIIAIGNSIFDMGLWSTYVNKRVLFPDIKHKKQYKKKLKYLLMKCIKKYDECPILLPMEDTTIEAIIDDNEIMGNCRCLLPNANSFYLANNKRSTMEQAKKLGIDIPHTKWFNCFDDLKYYISQINELDVVVKPEKGKGSHGLLYVDKTVKLKKLERIWHRYGRLMVQDRIPTEGESICVALLYSEEHKLCSYFIYKRLRCYPITGGPSTCRVGVHNNELLSKSCELLDSLNWVGVAMVEWKKDPRDNTYKLLEINPRFWGGLELAIKSGVNFPQHCVDILCNLFSGDGKFNYLSGIVSRWVFPGDILWFLSQKRKKMADYRDFFHNILEDSDELDKSDIIGSVASVVCQTIQAFNPLNWKYIIR